MNILVTGGAGFIGSHVVEALLQRGESVTVVDDFNDFYDPTVKHRNCAGFASRARVVEADIRDAARLRAAFAGDRFDAIIHLAARAGVRPSLAQPVLYAEVNVVGTQLVLELAREFGVGKCVLASSSSVYGVNQKVPFAEADPIFKPISPYAATKLATEALGHVYHHVHGLDVVCLRFFTVYGPRQRPDLAIHKFTRAIGRGETIELFGDGSTQRDYTFITDILGGILACLDRKFGFEIFNLGNSQPVSLLDLVKQIERAVGRPAAIRWLAEQPGDVPITFADVGKARKLLGYEPSVSIAEGIGKFVDWFRQQP